MFADGSLSVRHIWWLLRCLHPVVEFTRLTAKKKITRIYRKKTLHDLTIFLYTSYIFHSSHCRGWGGPVPSGFAACVPSNFGLFLLLLARSPLLVCSAGG